MSLEGHSTSHTPLPKPKLHEGKAMIFYSIGLNCKHQKGLLKARKMLELPNGTIATSVLPFLTFSNLRTPVSPSLSARVATTHLRFHFGHICTVLIIVSKELSTEKKKCTTAMNIKVRGTSSFKNFTLTFW